MVGGAGGRGQGERVLAPTSPAGDASALPWTFRPVRTWEHTRDSLTQLELLCVCVLVSAFLNPGHSQSVVRNERVTFPRKTRHPYAGPPLSSAWVPRLLGLGCRPSRGSGRVSEPAVGGLLPSPAHFLMGTDRVRTAARRGHVGRRLRPGSRLSPGEIGRTRHAPWWAASPAAADPCPRASGTPRHCGPTCGCTRGY